MLALGRVAHHNRPNTPWSIDDLAFWELMFLTIRLTSFVSCEHQKTGTGRASIEVRGDVASVSAHKQVSHLSSSHSVFLSRFTARLHHRNTLDAPHCARPRHALIDRDASLDAIST